MKLIDAEDDARNHGLRSKIKGAMRAARRALELKNPLPDKLKPDRISVENAGRVTKISGTWYRGENCNFHPARENLSEIDAVAKYVGQGWFPSQPFITKKDYITAFGSCFAHHVTKYLKDNRYRVFGDDMPVNSYVIRCGEGMVNTAVIAQQFRWAYDEIEFDQALWHDKEGNASEYLTEVRLNTRRIFDQTDVFIVTLGLSEVWYDKQSGEIFWRSIPRNVYDPSRHGFKILNVSENKSNLEIIYNRIRTRRPKATVIFTLSPVPLVATFRPVSCITANSVSKAILRVAVDEFMREHSDKDLYYFPSYEIVQDFYREDAFGDDLRHVRPEVVKTIMTTFHHGFLL
jgi:hypothetical protein